MLEFRTLGAVDLRGDDRCRVDSVLLHSKRLSLLAYLCATHPPKLHRRDTLVALFWPELDDAHAHGALRHELSRLRKALGAGALVTAGREAVAVDPQGLWCDVRAFHDAVDSGRLADALDLCRGEFLPGVHVEGGAFESWLDGERDRLSRMAIDAASRLVAEAEAAGDGPRAVACARRLTELAPYDETCWQTLMDLLERSGDRAEALVAYNTLAARLRAELEVEPSGETRALLERIRARDEAMAGSAIIALVPVDNQTGDPRLDVVARRLTDQLARGISGPQFAHVTLGNRIAKSTAVVVPAMYPRGDQVEVGVRIVEPGEAERVVAVAEPVLIRADGSDEPLDRLVAHVVVLLALHYDQRMVAPGVAALARVPSLESYMEYLRGADAFGHQRFAEAAEHLRRAYEVDNCHVRAAIFASIALAYDGQIDGADALASSALASGEPLPDYERNFGQWLLAFLHGRRAEAYRAVNAVLRLTQHPVFQMIRGWEARNLNRPRELLRCIAKIPNLGMGIGWWHNFTGTWDVWPGAYHTLKDHQAELGIALSGRALFPESFNPIRAEIRARAGLGQPEHVLKLLAEAATLDSQSIGVPSVRATLADIAWGAAAELDAHGQPRAAAKAREHGLRWLANRIAPTRADTVLEARLRLESGDSEGATRLLERVPPLKEVELPGLVGLVAAHRGDTGVARAVLAQLESIQNDYLSGRHLLLAAGIYAALDEAETAVETLRDAFAAGLSFSADLHALPMLQPLAGRKDFTELFEPRDV